MSDNILSAVLTFGLLASGTAAIGSEMFNTHRAAPMQQATQVVMLPAVTVIGHREQATQVVMLPTVTITGHREATQVVMLPAVTVTGHREAVRVAYDTSGSTATQRQ